MGKHGTYRLLSPFRRLVADLMYFSMQTPAVMIERRMDLSALAAARLRCVPRPAWTVLFTKAFALVGRDFPELRQAYMPYPFPRLYENRHSVAALNVERKLGDESIVLQCLIERPEKRSLAELDAILRTNQTTPLEDLRWFRRARTLSRLPLPIRRLVWWAALRMLGRQRCHNFGTFSVSSIAPLGAGIVHLLPILTASLHYGLFEPDFQLTMRMTFDHRVMDGATAARVMVALEQRLQSDIAAELNTMALRAAA
ncbi:MAG: hypothetical protein NZO58_13710 [Gemmataceae bacterium]|nr:hypothetical protein [Gemmataceae bacterium]